MHGDDRWILPSFQTYFSWLFLNSRAVLTRYYLDETNFITYNRRFTQTKTITNFPTKFSYFSLRMSIRKIYSLFKYKDFRAINGQIKIVAFKFSRLSLAIFYHQWKRIVLDFWLVIRFFSTSKKKIARAFLLLAVFRLIDQRFSEWVSSYITTRE